MLKSDAISYYGTQQKLAAECGLAASTVSEWGDVVPLGWAFVVQEMTKAARKVDMSCYTDIPPGLRPRRRASQ